MLKHGREYANAPWWEVAAEPGRMGFILFHRVPAVPARGIEPAKAAGPWLVMDVQNQLWLVRTQERTLRDAGFETFVGRFTALEFDPSYCGTFGPLEN